MQQARQWAATACAALGRHELTDSAQLGVSELVTNALLHADEPFSIRLRGTSDHPRIEVCDGSLEPPVLNFVDIDDPDDLLSTFGRGLNIVARCAVAWGAAIEPTGKVVWFEPTEVPQQGALPPGALFDLQDLPLARPEPQIPVRVQLRGVPVDAINGLRQHYHDLRREVRLLSLAHEEDYPLARDLTDVFTRFDHAYPREATEHFDRAAAAGRATTDLEIMADAAHLDTYEQMLALLDLADEFCRAQRLLSLARSPEQVVFQQWFLGEFIRQGHGEAPLAWAGATTVPVSNPRSANVGC
ncbi:MAG: ATP-binding protein [Nocardioidaceae bacterium]|nr:ATP-binding protein [Nocardioidaceae bacterium]